MIPDTSDKFFQRSPGESTASATPDWFQILEIYSSNKIHKQSYTMILSRVIFLIIVESQNLVTESWFDADAQTLPVQWDTGQHLPADLFLLQDN